MATATAPKGKSKGNDSEELLTEADRQWGYRFGADGVISYDEAAKMLGGCHVATVRRRILAGEIRSGRYRGAGKVMICKRSVTNHLSNIEE